MIDFINVNKSFGKHKVLDALNLHIEKGKITFILGKSGEGKSVTIKHIMGLLRPDEGKIHVDGQDITELSESELRIYRRNFGMLFQHAALFDSMSVLENVMFPLKEHTNLKQSIIKSRAFDILEQIEILDLKDRYPNQLSTGEKKRVGLARALIEKPKVILYDEPTTGMDPLVSEMIDKLIVQVNKDQTSMTSVVISHDLKAALATGERIIMLYKGRVALAGEADDFRKTTDPVVRQFFSGKITGPMEFI